MAIHWGNDIIRLPGSTQRKPLSASESPATALCKCVLLSCRDTEKNACLPQAQEAAEEQSNMQVQPGDFTGREIWAWYEILKPQRQP